MTEKESDPVQEVEADNVAEEVPESDNVDVAEVVDDAESDTEAEPEADLETVDVNDTVNDAEALADEETLSDSVPDNVVLSEPLCDCELESEELRELLMVIVSVVDELPVPEADALLVRLNVADFVDERLADFESERDMLIDTDPELVEE